LPLEDSYAVVQAALAQPGVIAASRRTKTGGMVGNREGNFPVAIIGIEAQQEARVSLLAEAQALFNLRDQATEVVVSLERVGQEQPVVTTSRAALPGYDVDAWEDLNPEMKQPWR
jgi:ABC-type lipoprotein release transport system permease subunit